MILAASPLEGIPILELVFLLIGLAIAVCGALVMYHEPRERPSDRYNVPRRLDRHDR